jgi:hypothetical protein
MGRSLFRTLGPALLAASGFAAPAAADWQYTRWGMSPEQVVAASRGAVQLGPPPSGKSYENLTGRARGVYTEAGASFDAYFHFDAEARLARVALERTGGTECAPLHNRLLAELGRPATSTRQPFATIDQWRDRARGNLVGYVLVGQLPCTITYSRVP